MQAEQLVDLQSQKIFLSAINASLKQQNRALQVENQVLQKITIGGRTFPKKITLAIILVLIPTITIIPNSLDMFHANIQDHRDTNYLIQNLRGDTVNTWLHWNKMTDEQIIVNIMNADAVSEEKLDRIKDAILSDQSIQIDDSLLHKGLSGQTSTYYKGWHGALMEASKNSTKFFIPTTFVMMESPRGEGDITIWLSTEVNADGYAGYTRSSTENNQILKSAITIYNVDELSAEQISSIMRHEFGHALGLAHSSAPEDLMAAQITTPYPYISGCDISAITSLYNGDESSQVVCEK